MVTIELPGDPSSALALLAPVGLVGILDEAGLGPAYMKWTFDEVESGREVVPSRAQVMCSAGSVDDIAAAVRRHAERHLQPDSWLQARIEGLSNAGKGLFSPRAGIRPGDWGGYLAQREETLERLSPRMTYLDWAFLAGLGEPAWWQADQKDARPDKGASRWEMQLRTSGREIVSFRVEKLAVAVSNRATPDVLRSLVGDDVFDECRKKAECRCASGLTPPGPTDCVQAWLALWGFTTLPVVPVLSSALPAIGRSQSPGMWPPGRHFPTNAALPFIVEFKSWRAFRSVMLTRHFLLVATQPWLDPAPGPAIDDGPTGARAWLREQGVAAIVRFEIHKSDVQNPELQIRAGNGDRL